MKTLLLVGALLHLGLCLEDVPEPLSVPDRCQQAPDPGQCGDFNIRWFYNPKVGKCLRFYYSGCDGNGNNFKEESECNTACGSASPSSGDELGSQEFSAETVVTEQEEPILKVNAGEEESGLTTEDQDVSKTVETEKTENDEENNLSPELKAPSEMENTENKLDTDEATIEEDEDEEGLDDGEDDDRLIHDYLAAGSRLAPEDEEILKEAMAQFDVSVLKSEENEEDELIEENDAPAGMGQLLENGQSPIASEIQQEDAEGMLHENAESIDVVDNIPAEHNAEYDEETEAEEDVDDGTETDELIQKYLTTGMKIEPEDEEILKEAMSQFDVSAMEQAQQAESDIGQEDTEPPVEMYGEQSEVTSEQHQSSAGENTSQMIAEQKTPEEKTTDENAREDAIQETDNNDEDEEEDDGSEDERIINKYLNPEKVMDPEDAEMLKEAMSQFEVSAFDTIGSDEEDLPSVEQEPVEEMEGEDKLEMETEEGIVNQFLNPLGNKVTTGDRQSILETISELGAASMAAMGELNSEESEAIETVANAQEMMQPKESESDFIDTEHNVKYNDEEERKPIWRGFRALKKFKASKYDRGFFNKKKVKQIDNSEPHILPDGRLIAPMCVLEPKTGPCRARQLKWFFDPDTGLCRTFVFGGCKGNANRFASKRKCQKICRGEMPSGGFVDTALNEQPIPVEEIEQPRTLEEIEQPGPFEEIEPQSPARRITIMFPFRTIFRGFGQTSEEEKPQLPFSPKVAVPPEMSSPLFEPRKEPFEPHFENPERDFNVDQKREDYTEPQQPFGGLPAPFFMLKRLLGSFVRTRESHLPEELFSENRPEIRHFRDPENEPPRFFDSQQVSRPTSRFGAIDRPNHRSNIPFENQRILQSSQRRDFTMTQQDNSNPHKIFAPSITKNAQMKSQSHDNRHFSNISPKSKFTLLQVFVNKPHGQMRPEEDESNSGDPQQQSIPEFRQPPMARTGQPPMFYPPYSPMMRPLSPWWSNPHMPNQQMQFQGQATPYHSFPKARMAPPADMPYNQSPQIPERMAHIPSMNMRQKERPPVAMVTEDDSGDDEHMDDHFDCLLPLAPGRCKAFQTRWYFNRKTSKCEIFYFTGCGGNANNFQTWEECASTCLDVQGPRTTSPGTLKSDEENFEPVDSEEAQESEPETIVFTSTVLPETEEEARAAQNESEDDTEEAPSAEELRTTLSPPVKGDVSAVKSSEGDEESPEVLLENVEESAVKMSTEYVALVIIVSVIGLAVVVLVIVTVVHLSKKTDTGKKEKVLEAVLNHHLYEDLPKLMVHKGKTPPSEKGAAEEA